jgi:hypothetical protein
MSRLFHSLIQACWGLGVICMLAGVVFRLIPTLQEKTTFSGRGGLIVAGVLFLCALATRELERTVSPGS